MAEEIEKQGEQGEQENDDINYANVIEELKKNSVSRDEFNKVKKENKQLLDALVNNKQIKTGPETQVDRMEIIKKLKGGNLSNLEYAKAALELRKSCLDAGERDPFLPHGHNIGIDPEDEEKAQRVADAFEYCIDYADGDSEVFTNELQRITRDVRVPRRF